MRISDWSSDVCSSDLLLHGASGVQSVRELTYARQFAAQGVAALAVDVFAPRRERASGFINRLLEITEAMFLADAYAALDYLATRPEIEPGRCAPVGLPYGGLVAGSEGRRGGEAGGRT